ncbi:tRNA(1-methyladenosine) methyltransferase-related methyltransferase [Archaeoglobus sulfaticallidus PM70-1]|uniref:tRNA(1-methyladenosine) methyltransferase-related methyltransferase n=1 Tax=Archaeoglobus sulfaticallidus PM70-1 TaxID=387631 RepID=N0BEN6_9EURY|nr:tRNA (adenine-N1)-methyltransferase [Archaeoglobus sulfaticallidus]AGK60737.1 tRNA(1-methyladenosine) methyltransferase-related methyltransferase [Archaeoglobus sulfaticallidus PM70-1]
MTEKTGEATSKVSLPLVIFSGKTSYIINSFEGEFHTHKGVIDLSKLKDLNYGDEVETHLGFKFKVRPFSLSDFFKHFRKGPTPIMPKDIGAIIAFTGLRPDSAILDCGTGSGVLSAYLAYFCRDGFVVTVEKRKDFAKIARKNFELAGLKNIHQIVGDIFGLADSIKIKFDLIVLDMKDDDKFIPKARELLKNSGYLVVYNPYIDATRDAYFAMLNNNFQDIESFEIVKIDYEHKRAGTRPSTRVWHSGFLVVGRKID